MSLVESFSLLDELPEPPDDDDGEEDDEVLAAPAAVPNLVSITSLNNALSLHECICKQQSERNAVKKN